MYLLFPLWFSSPPRYRRNLPGTTRQILPTDPLAAEVAAAPATQRSFWGRIGMTIILPTVVRCNFPTKWTNDSRRTYTIHGWSPSLWSSCWSQALLMTVAELFRSAALLQNFRMFLLLVHTRINYKGQLGFVQAQHVFIRNWKSLFSIKQQALLIYSPSLHI